MESKEPKKELIFREKAHRLYLQNQQKIVVLKLVRPKVFPFFWALLAGLALLTGTIWHVEVPVTLKGIGLVVDIAGADGPTLASLLPPSSSAQVRSNQRVTAHQAGRKDMPALVARIDQVEPTVMSPSAIRQRLALDPEMARWVEQPAVLVLAKIETEPAGLGLETYTGSSFQVEVEVASRPVLSMIPGLRAFF